MDIALSEARPNSIYYRSLCVYSCAIDRFAVALTRNKSARHDRRHLTALNDRRDYLVTNRFTAFAVHYIVERAADGYIG